LAEHTAELTKLKAALSHAERQARELETLRKSETTLKEQLEQAARHLQHQQKLTSETLQRVRDLELSMGPARERMRKLEQALGTMGVEKACGAG
jgi:methyl-accepting chemotaxis protein